MIQGYSVLFHLWGGEFMTGLACMLIVYTYVQISLLVDHKYTVLTWQENMARLWGGGLSNPKQALS